MTEAEWLASKNPASMLIHLGMGVPPVVSAFHLNSSQNVSERQLRAWVEACRLSENRSDREWGNYDLDGGNLEWALRVWGECNQSVRPVNPLPARAAILRDIVGNPFRLIEIETNTRCVRCGSKYLKAEYTICLDCGGYGGEVGPSWLTPTVLSLAKAAYDNRDFSILPVLADALEDAGCQQAELLLHLRTEEDIPCSRCFGYKDDPESLMPGEPGYHPERDPASGRHEGGWTNCKTCNSGGNKHAVRPGTVRVPLQGPHVRGCWAIDLILGKDWVA